MHEITTPFGDPEFLVLAGSRLYGMDTPESDYDYVGALIEPAEYRLGLKKNANQHGFEQHMFKGDDHEGSIYSLWKLVQMFAEGNPTILCLMFADPLVDEFGICTDKFRKMVSSRKSGHRFMKYMEAQRKSMIGERAKHVTRLQLIEDYGFDTKFAAHLIRLGYQGCEFLSTGKITLPMPDESLTAGCLLNVLDVRYGKWSMAQVISESEALQARMEALLATTELPEEPDWDRLSEWLTDWYRGRYSLIAMGLKESQKIT
jgi:uncharacterized protein